MMSREIRRFDIQFKDPMASFKPGDVLAGSVHLELSQELKMRGVKLFLQGISRVALKEERSYTKGSSTNVLRKNVDVYLDEPIMVCPGVEGNTMKAGRYDWPFNLRLPPFLPSSFEGQYGRVQYWAKAVIDRPWKGDTDFTRNFTVLGQLDLNTEEDARKPIEGIADTVAGQLCFRSGPITGQIVLPQRGYVSGQCIPFTVRVQNKSKRPIRNVRVTLTQVAMFKAEGQTKKQTVLLKGLTWRDITAGENISWEDELKNIPAVPPSRLGAGCKGIDVKYLVSLVANTGSGKGLEVPVEVIIGTVPLRKTEAGTPKLTVKAAAKKNLDATELKGEAKPRASPRPSPGRLQ